MNVYDVLWFSKFIASLVDDFLASSWHKDCSDVCSDASLHLAPNGVAGPCGGA